MDLDASVTLARMRITAVVMKPLVTLGRLSTLDREMEQRVESRTTIRVPQGGARAHLCLGNISDL